MKSIAYFLLGVIFALSFGGASAGYAAPVWNEACPAVLPSGGPTAAALAAEIPDWDSDHRTQLSWPSAGVRAPGRVDPNSLALCRKVVGEIFRPGVIAANWTDDKVLLTTLRLRNIGGPLSPGKTAPTEQTEPVLFFRVETDKYVLQFMKRAYACHVTIRLVDGETFDIEKLAPTIFAERVLPPEWKAPCYGALERSSRVLRAGYWTARDIMQRDDAGHYRIVDTTTAVISKAPLGKGLYGSSYFYTNGQFATVAIYAGPDPANVISEP